MPGACSLVFETSTPHASLALVRTAGPVAQREFCSDRNHNSLLFGPLRELLEIDDGRNLSRVLVGSGPGSYSGTRVGIAAAQGVAMALACPAIAVPSILAVPCVQDGATGLAIGDARRGSYWSATVADCSMLDAPVLCDAAGLAAVVAQALAAGVTVFTFENPARLPLPEETILQIMLEIPDATRLWQAWCNTTAATRRQWLAAIPQPLYLKPPHITPAKRSCWLH